MKKTLVRMWYNLEHSFASASTIGSSLPSMLVVSLVMVFELSFIGIVIWSLIDWIMSLKGV